MQFIGLLVQGGACGVVFGVIWFLTARWRKSTLLTTTTVQAQRFELVNAYGEMRAVLMVADDDRVGLFMLDEQARQRLSIQVLANGSPGLYLYDGVKHPRLCMGLSNDNAPGLVMTDMDATPRTTLSLLPDGSPTLGMFDASGKPL